MPTITQLRQLTRNAPSQSALMMAFLLIDEKSRQLTRKSREELYELQKCLMNADDDEDRAEILDTILEILESKPVKYRQMQEVQVESPKEGMSKWIAFVSKRIKEEREAAGITQTELAEKAGLPQSHISRLEAGHHSPTHLTLQKIAKALKIEMQQLDPTAE